MKRIYIFTIFILTLATCSFGQTSIKAKDTKSRTKKVETLKSNIDPKALNVLDRASIAYNKAGGVKAGFSLKVLGSGGVENNTIEGTIRLKGSKFKLEVKEMITWFDGKNQWVYLVETKEVNLSNPTEEELLMINPVNVFQLYKHGYNCKYLGEKDESGLKTQKVLLTPADKYSSILSLEASFDKISLRPVKIVITNKDKSGSIISIPRYLTGQTYADVFFSFPQKEYPNLDVIDLR
jgi:outer membrane lipoprotein-sorting protein